jgi:hypothetical protein
LSLAATRCQELALSSNWGQLRLILNIALNDVFRTDRWRRKPK